MGGMFHQPGYVHDGVRRLSLVDSMHSYRRVWQANPNMTAYVGPAGPTTTMAAPYGYGQEEDKYEGPTFPHVPTVVRPVPTVLDTPWFDMLPPGSPRWRRSIPCGIGPPDVNQVHLEGEV